MILNEVFLSSVLYYTYDTEKFMKMGEEGLNSVFTLHFIKWWKFKKVIKIRWVRTTNENGREVFAMPDSAKTLKLQLDTYFNNHNSVKFKL